MSYSRQNNATKASIDNAIFAYGTFKEVRKGTYTNGQRSGQACVSKEFKSGSVFEDHYFQEEMNIINRTQKIINAWHAEGRINRTIVLNTPEIWTYTVSGHKNLVEPMIENFQKFNSNSGWADNNSGAWSHVMQALSHFSYHNSGGQFVLCDLQGGVYSDGYILSDPVIMSQRRNCGPADLGPDGIRDFFSRHRCGPYCSAQWSRPRTTMGPPTYPMRQGTTMVALPTRRNRNPLTHLRS